MSIGPASAGAADGPAGAADEPASAGAADDWGALTREVTACRACAELAATRQRVVVGDPGPGPEPRLAFVGEAPGAQEDAAGRPFVGKAGQLLDQLLQDSGMSRADVAVLNVIKCRPPGNRRPSGDEIARCRPYLERQLDLLRPRLVVALGLTAVAWFLAGPRGGGGAGTPGGARRTTLAAARGVVHDARGYRVIATYHPSAAIRFGPAGAPLAALREDLDFAARVLAGVSI
jgi:DNA polymerase